MKWRKGMEEHLALQTLDWRARLDCLDPELCYPVWEPEYSDKKIILGKRLMIFLRGTELPGMLRGHCEQCGAGYEFVNYPKLTE